MGNDSKKTQIKEEKLKSLLPTLRMKKRFILFEIESSKTFSFKDVSEHIVDELLVLLGSIEYGKGGIWLLRDKFDEKKQQGVLKVSVKKKDTLIGALALITKLESTPVRIKVVSVSGTLKGLRK